MDPGKIVSIRMTLDKIREEAESFRATHIFSSSLPVDIENVVEVTLGMKDDTLGWFETQASEFAGRLLVPLDSLVEEFRSKRQIVIKKFSSWDSPKINDDDLFSIVSPLICSRFDVSAEVIERRLRKENIMNLIG